MPGFAPGRLAVGLLLVLESAIALRAKVEVQTRQQQVISARNELAKQKIVLGRVVGLPTGQGFMLSSAVTDTPLPKISFDEPLSRAVDYGDIGFNPGNSHGTVGATAALNIEVVQAQQAVAGADESLISSLYFDNVSTVALGRAIGDAEAGVQEYLKGR
jgi:hypothetical protein